MSEQLVPVAAGVLLVIIAGWRWYVHREGRRRVHAVRQYQSLFDNNTDAVISLDREGTVEDVNAAFTRLTGWTTDSIAGTDFVDHLVTEDRKRVSESLRAAWAGEPQTCEAVLEDRKGRLIEVKLTSVPISVGSGVVGVYQIAQDIRLRKEIERKLETQALHDYLTGLPNRALFQDRLEHAFEKRHRAGTQVALFYIDLDRFKAINDGAGHEAGDALLRTAANRLGGFLRGGDTVARLGGDEFAILLEGITDRDALGDVAKRVVNLFYEPFYWKGRELQFGASVGVALSTPETESPDELVRRADVAMYAAKRLGGHRYQIYRPELEDQRDAIPLQMEGDLRRGIRRDELVVHYQPIVDLAGTRVVGVEALARWRHPEFGLLAPDRFIPLAEKTGLIVPLDRWVLTKACRDVKRLHRVGRSNGTAPFLSVNYSRLHLHSEDSLDAIAYALASEQFDAHMLQLEITETVAGSDRDKVRALTELKSLGVMLAIDDFGTGYSSLGYLKDIEVDVLKVDRSLVRKLGEEQAAVAIVRTILTLADMLGMGVIVEGIEDASQLRQLQELGGRYVQGFYFAQPMELEALERVVRQGLPPEWVSRLNGRPTARGWPALREPEATAGARA